MVLCVPGKKLCEPIQSFFPVTALFYLKGMHWLNPKFYNSKAYMANIDYYIA